jgi:hypothetical protein
MNATMNYFTFTTTDHELTLRERVEMRAAVFVTLEHEQAGWKIPGFTGLVSLLGEYAAVGAFARLLATPAVVGMLSIVLVVGLRVIFFPLLKLLRDLILRVL